DGEPGGKWADGFLPPCFISNFAWPRNVPVSRYNGSLEQPTAGRVEPPALRVATYPKEVANRRGAELLKQFSTMGSAINGAPHPPAQPSQHIVACWYQQNNARSGAAPSAATATN